MKIKPLSRTAVRVQAALSAILLPKIAMDSQLKLSTAIGTGLIQIGKDEKFTRKALSKESFRKAIVKMAKDAAEPMLTPEAKKSGGAGPDDVIMRVLDMVDGQMSAEEEEVGEDEEEGAEKPKAGGEGGLRKKVGDALREAGMDEEGCAKIMDMMPAEDEEEEKPKAEDKEEGEEEKPKAEDKDEEDDKEKEKAMDEALKKATKTAEENTMKRLHAIRAAERAVFPLIGEVSVAMDSADEIYKTALKAHDVSTEGVDPSAFPALVEVLARTKSEQGKSPRIALDSATVEGRAAFDKAHGISARPVRNLGAA